MRHLASLAAAAWLSTAAAPAFADTTCAPGTACTASGFSYKPGDTTITVFGQVVVELEDHQPKTMGDANDDEGEVAKIEFGQCLVAIKRYKEAFPLASEKPAYRTDFARTLTEDAQKRLPPWPKATGQAMREVRSEPGLGIYELRYYMLDEDKWYARRAIVAGDRFLVLKLCRGAKSDEAEDAARYHSVKVPVGQ
jgi:hypothetical protein